MKSISWFTRFSKRIARTVGQPVTFGLAALIILLWLISGPVLHFSDTWQLMINTGTTIVTFLMVFIIQNTQNRDTMAMQVKLDELLRVQQGAHNALLDLEELDGETLEAIRDTYQRLASKARKGLDVKQFVSQDSDQPFETTELPEDKEQAG